MRKIIAAAFVGILIIAGCTPSRMGTFYWGEYSSTLYNLKKNPSDTTLSLHQKEILLIINESEEREKKVPPGLFAEYGYILLRQGDEKEGLSYLDRELEVYPESSVFINRIKQEYTRDTK